MSLELLNKSAAIVAPLVVGTGITYVVQRTLSDLSVKWKTDNLISQLFTKALANGIGLVAMGLYSKFVMKNTVIRLLPSSIAGLVDSVVVATFANIFFIYTISDTKNVMLHLFKHSVVLGLGSYIIKNRYVVDSCSRVLKLELLEPLALVVVAFAVSILISYNYHTHSKPWD